MRLVTGLHNGDLVLKSDTHISGTVAGTVFVKGATVVVVDGMINGDIVADPEAKIEVKGMHHGVIRYPFGQATVPSPAAEIAPAEAMVITTTPSVEGRKITAYRGIVTGEAILGVNIFRDMFASVRDVVGGRARGFERSLGEARATALAEMQERAQALGGNAVVGVDLDYEVINNMLMVSASGTAVTIG